MVDGIDVSSEAVGIAGSSQLATGRLLDIERIEVVKGPQSALFGRSAFAGAIQYITKDPAKEFEAQLEGNLNSQAEQDVSASLSLPLGDRLGVRFNGQWWKDDGSYRNVITGRKIGNGEGFGGALTLKAEPTEAVTLKFRAEYTDDEFGVPAQANIPYNGTTRVPDSASSCLGVAAGAPAGATPGPINDPRCVGSTAQLLQALSGNTTIFNDMVLPAFIGTIPDARSLRVTMSPNYIADPSGLTDGNASTRSATRLSLVANWSIGIGTISSLTGWTDSDQASDFDTDKYAIPGATLGADLSTIDNRLIYSSRTEQLSQELRFVSDLDGMFNFVAGVQYWKEDVHQDDRNQNLIANGYACSYFDPPGPAPATPAPCGFSSIPVAQFMDDVAAVRRTSYTERSVEHRSGYLQLTFEPTEAWRFTAEARYTDEDNSVTGPDPIEVVGGTGFYNETSAGNSILILCGATGPCSNLPSNPIRGFRPLGSGFVNPLPTTCAPPLVTVPGPCLPAGFVLPSPDNIYRTYERNDKYTTPRVSVEYKPDRGRLFYASYSVGQKPGGITTLFNGSLGEDRGLYEFLPEKLKEYELGTKVTLGGRVLVNAALFYEDCSDKQVQTQVPIGNLILTRTTNASAAEVKGLEASVFAQLTDRFSFNLGYQYLDTSYKDFVVATSSAGEIGRVGNCTATRLVAGAAPTCLVDRSGNSLEEAPEHSVALTATYRAPFGATGMRWFVEGDAIAEGERFIDDANTIKANDYVLTNFRAGLESERWSALLYVENALDQDTPLSGGTGPGTIFATFRAATIVAPGSAVPFRGVFAPAFPTTYFANLPDPRQVGLRVTYRFR